MNKFLCGAAVTVLLATVGCATVDQNYVDAKRAAAARGEASLLTGTRLTKPTTERVVKSVGNNEYNETNLHTSIGNASVFKEKTN